MIKALIKKQMLELIASLFNRRRNKKSSTTTVILLFVALLSFGGGSAGFMIYMMAQTMYEGMAPQNLTWLYFSFFSVLSFGLGLIGSVFLTYTTLYSSKDNDLLLSMPIKPVYILLARTIGLYFITALFEAIILIPTEIQYIVAAGFNAVQFILFLVTLVVLPLFTFVFSALFGYIVALIAPKVKNKSAVSVILGLIFFGVYFYVYFRFNEILGLIVSNADKVSTVMKYAFFPFYALGAGVCDSPLWFLAFASITAAAFAVVYWILQRSFIKLATTTAKTARREYKGEVGAQGSPSSALLKKELSRYFSCPAYLLNTIVGVFMVAVAVVAALFNRAFLDRIAQALPPGGVPAVVILAIGFFAGMSSPTAPSISLEGQTLPILRSLPVSSKAILQAKLNLHLIVIALPSFIFHMIFCFLFIPDPWAAMIASFGILPILHLSGVFGLIFNLRHPYLDWANEAVVVKQSSSVLFTMLSIFGVLVCSGVPTVLLAFFTQASAYVVLAVVIGILLAFDTGFTALLYKWGPGKLETI